MKTNKIKFLLPTLSALLLGAILLAGCIAFVEYDPPDPHYVPVEAINGVPTGGVKDFALILSRSVSPSNATNKAVTWTIANDGGTHSILDRNVLIATEAGTVTVRATIKNGGATRADDYTQDFNIEISDVFYAVTNIANIPETCVIGEVITLNGLVRPSNATNKTIEWELNDAGTTGAVFDGTTLIASSDGTIIVTATIANGKAPGIDYTQDFAITVRPPVPVVYVVGRVNGNEGIETACYWEIEDDYTTLHLLENGSDGNSDALAIAAEDGIVYIIGFTNYGGPQLWVVEDGRVTKHSIENDAELMRVAVSNGKVYIAGFSNSGMHIPCYWVWEKDETVTQHPLTVPVDHTIINVRGIAVSGSSVYISGDSDISGDTEACYWVNGVYHKLEGGTSAYGVAVMGNDVYIMGGSGYWKNGTYNTLTKAANDTNGDWSYFVGAIIVNDGKWYMSGFYDDDGSSSYGCYWENGVFHPVNDLNSAGAVVIQGGKVYAVGEDDQGYGLFWKDGAITNLPSSGALSSIYYGLAPGWK